MEKLIKRTYRISISDDKSVKKKGKKHGGESAYMRKLIRQGEILESELHHDKKNV